MTAQQPAGTAGLWRTVCRREITAKLHDKTFLVSTLVTLLIVIVSFTVSALLQGREQHNKVAVVDDGGAAIVKIANDTAAASGSKESFEAVLERSPEAARSALKDGKADVLLERRDGVWHLDGLNRAPNLTSLTTSIVARAVNLASVSELARAAGKDPAAAMASTRLVTGTLESGASLAQQQVGTVLAVAFAVLFYLSALIFGYSIANSVVEEKQSRIVEILLACVPSRQLLVGKVLGNTVLALAQMVLIIAVALVGMSFSPWSAFLSYVGAPAVWFVVFFVIGFLSLACLWAAAGSLASRSEDVQATASPLLFVVMAVFFFGMYAHGTAQVVASYIPVASAIAMPGRLAAGTAAWWEPVVSIAISLVFSALTIWAGERIYRRAIMQTGGRLSLRTAWSSKDAVA